jgi:hypothetical protein
MPRAPHEYLFKKGKPFMQRTMRDDVVALIASLVGFAAGYVLIGDDQPLLFAVFLGAGVLMIGVQAVIRRVIRQRRDAGSGFPPPD